VVAVSIIVLSANIEQLIVQGAATTATGSGGNEIIYGLNSSLGLTLDGGGGNDTIYGSAQSDSLTGGTGNDIMLGFGGTNTFAGGDGDDQYYTSSASDTLTEAVGAGNDIVIASYNATLGANFEQLILLPGATSGIGNNDANVLNGSIAGGGVTLSGLGGNDTLFGSAFGDTLAGGSGNDTLFGDAGNDTFLYNGGGLGVDTITDFTGGPGLGDVINVQTVFADFAAVQAAATQQGADTVITIDVSDKIVLANFNVGNLDPNDFLF